jgi:ribosomal protein S4
MVSGINAATTIAITGGTYSIKGRSYTSASGTVSNGDTVTVQLISSGNYSTTTNATLTIGGISDTFSVATIDVIPDQFTFTDQTDAVLSTVITSNTITVTGITSTSPISITGGTYSINGGPYTSASGTVSNSDTVTVQLTSSGNYSSTTNATLTISGISDTFSVTTQSAPPDMTPDQFTFTDQTGAALSTVITSNTITVSGITSTTPISITGGTYSINGGPYTSADGTVNPEDAVTVQQTSSESHSTTTDATLTIGGISDTFSVTTISGSSGGGAASSGGGCFIATAAFGSPLAGQVEILRQFRDRYLLTNDLGRKFVAWYYRNGPVAANYIKDKPLVKAAVRLALYPLIGFSLLLINGVLPYLLLVIAGSVTFFRFRTRKFNAT